MDHKCIYKLGFLRERDGTGRRHDRARRRLAVLTAGAVLLAAATAAYSELTLSDQESEVYYDFLVAAGEGVDADGGARLEGDLHSNAGVRLKAGSTVAGDVAAVGKIDGDGTVDGTREEGAAPLVLPRILDETALRALADRVLEGDVTFDDVAVDDVLFVDGTIRVRGNLGGTGTLIATRDIRLDTTGNPSFVLDEGSRISLVAKGDIRVGKERPFRGVLRAGRDVAIEKDVELHGVVVADRRVEVKKDARLVFVDFDEVAPEIALVEPADGGVLATATPRIEVAWSDDLSGLDLATAELLLDGADRTGEAEVSATGLVLELSAPLADGLHTLEVALADHSDNEARESFTFTTDTTAPSLAITSPAAPVVTNVLPDVEVSYADATSGVDVASLVLAVDGTPLLGCAVGAATASCLMPALAEGAHTVSAAVSDRAGNPRAASFDFAFVVDQEGPVLTVTSPADGDTVAEESLPVTGTASDESGVAEVRVNGVLASLAGEAWSATVTLVPGSNTLVVEARDVLGNPSAVSLTVTLGGLDATPPSLTLDAPLAGLFLNEPRPLIEVSFADDESGVDPASLAFTANGAALAVDCDLGPADARCTPAAALADGAVVLAAALADQAGNVATASVDFTVDTAGVEVDLTAPQDRLVTRDASTAVSGTVGGDVTSVEVNGVAATLAGSSFSATVALREGTHMVVALATKSNGNTGTASIEVTRDVAAPIVKIDTPRDGFVAVTDRVAVTGLVNDVVTGGLATRVLVNGVETPAAGGAFLLLDVPLVRGPNTIEAVATDAVGNEGRDAVTVFFQPPAGARIEVESGNGQSEVVNQAVARPLVVVVRDGLGNPLAGRVARFEMTRNSGTLRAAAGDEPRRAVQVPTDGSGRAAVFLTLGDTAGEGNNRVRATAVGVAGEAEFCATALTAPPEKALMVAGDNQRGLVGHPLARPLEALIADRDSNPVVGVAVTFEVVKGTGQLDGQGSLVKITGVDGLARAVLTLGMDPGLNNNVVAASFTGLAGLPATFKASGLLAGDPAQTRLAGVVLDNGQTPIPDARVSIADTALQTLTDGEGQFELTGVPVGRVELHVDPSSSPRPEEFPPLAFETVTVAGQTNTIGQPILIPAVDVGSAKIVGASQDVTLVMTGVEGLSLTVFANSATFPDGSKTGLLSISQVHLDKVPMAPPSGTIFMPPAWTIQPAGVRFDPPARITIPNDGLPPGRVIDIFQFDHTLNVFIDVGKGTVSDDGFVIVSDPGFGITRAGWGGCGQPSPPDTCLIGCDDGNECTDDRCVNDNCEFTPVADGTGCSDEGDACTQDTCQGGACSHEEPVECEECQRCREGDCETDPDQNGSACEDEGNPSCSVDKCENGECEHMEVTPVTSFSPDPLLPDFDGLNEATRQGMNCLQAAADAAGGTMGVRSAFRPQDYQDHLREAWDKNEKLSGWTEAECAEVRQNVNGEFALHGMVARPARVSNHSQGNAFDARVTLPAGQDIDDLAEQCNLRRPHPQRDPVHFQPR